MLTQGDIFVVGTTVVERASLFLARVKLPSQHQLSIWPSSGLKWPQKLQNLKEMQDPFHICQETKFFSEEPTAVKA